MNEINIKTCKDKDPKETVKYIKYILHNLNIETKEYWHNKSIYDTYSLHLVVKNTNIDSYGKGYTKVLAQASAYGEFIERYLNMILTGPLKLNESNYKLDINEKYLTAEEIILQNCEIINRIFRINKISKNNNVRVKWFKKQIKPDIKGKYLCLPLKNYMSGKICYIPYFITSTPYGSNGMCAGNTKEEALVEGISEIIERYVSKKVVLNKLALPDIPDTYINKFQSIKNLWSKLKSQDKYQAYLKDASLGGKWPVVALVVINKKTSNYGISFGAHPNFEIAAQRTFTEATQNITLDNFSNHFNIYDKEVELETTDDWSNIFTGGLKCYPFNFFKNKSNFDFKKFHNNSSDNKKLLKHLVDILVSNKYQVWIKDSSCFDIPAFQIIVPNMSEIIEFNESQISNNYENKKVNNLLSNIHKISDANAKLIIKNLINYSHIHQRNTLECLLPSNNGLNIPCGQNISGKNYLISMLYFFLKDYKNAYNSFLKITKNIVSEKDVNKFRIHKAIEKYLLLRHKKYSHNNTIEILNKFYDAQICNYIDYVFKTEKQVLKKQYPNISKILNSNPTFYPYWESQNMTKKLLKCKELYSKKV